jgi:hypothetical protein
MGLRKSPKALVKNHTILNVQGIEDTTKWTNSLSRSCKSTMKENGQIDKAWNINQV